MARLVPARGHGQYTRNFFKAATTLLLPSNKRLLSGQLRLLAGGFLVYYVGLNQCGHHILTENWGVVANEAQEIASGLSAESTAVFLKVLPQANKVVVWPLGKKVRKLP